MTITTPPPPAPTRLPPLEDWPVVEEQDGNERQDEDQSGACHILAGASWAGASCLCGAPSLFAAVDPREGSSFNFLGPRCDGPNGCGAQRCQRCASLWAGRENGHA